MVIRLSLMLVFISACGNNTVLKNNKLESLTPLTASQAGYLKTGLLTKGTPSRVQYQGQSFTVSIYSSKSAQDFIAAMPQGASIPITFTGGTSANQIVLESVQRR